jgi:hypothetical protein
MTSFCSAGSAMKRRQAGRHLLDPPWGRCAGARRVPAAVRHRMRLPTRFHAVPEWQELAVWQWIGESGEKCWRTPR